MSEASDESSPTELVAGESGDAIQIRYVESHVGTTHDATAMAMPSAAVPRRSQRILNSIYLLPGAAFLAARISALAGSVSLGWKCVTYASVAAEIVMLTFRKPLVRAIERASVRWTIWAGRHPALISIEGTVIAGTTLESDLSGEPGVLVRTRRTDPSRALASDGLWGVEFMIQADDGLRYAVAPSAYLYFDEPPLEPPDGVEATETLLRPGDRVRVWGTVVQEPSASGRRPDPRSPPMRLALVGSEKSPLVLRFVKPPTVAALPVPAPAPAALPVKDPE
jgi:hypothetical protein